MSFNDEPLDESHHILSLIAIEDMCNNALYDTLQKCETIVIFQKNAQKAKEEKNYKMLMYIAYFLMQLTKCTTFGEGWLQFMHNQQVTKKYYIKLNVAYMLNLFIACLYPNDNFNIIYSNDHPIAEASYQRWTEFYLQTAKHIIDT